jgi:hypothetical protein
MVELTPKQRRAFYELYLKEMQYRLNGWDSIAAYYHHVMERALMFLQLYIGKQEEIFPELWAEKKREWGEGDAEGLKKRISALQRAIESVENLIRDNR